MVVIVKQSRLVGGTLASSSGQGTRAENGASRQCNQVMSGGGREPRGREDEGGERRWGGKKERMKQERQNRDK